MLQTAWRRGGLLGLAPSPFRPLPPRDNVLRRLRRLRRTEGFSPKPPLLCLPKTEYLLTPLIFLP